MNMVVAGVDGFVVYQADGDRPAHVGLLYRFPFLPQRIGGDVGGHQHPDADPGCQVVVLPDAAGVCVAEPFLQRDRRQWRHSEVVQSHVANLPVRGVHVAEAHAGAVAVDLGAAAGVVGDEDDAKICPVRLLECHLSRLITIPTRTPKEAVLGK